MSQGVRVRLACQGLSACHSGTGTALAFDRVARARLGPSSWHGACRPGFGHLGWHAS